MKPKSPRPELSPGERVVWPARRAVHSDHGRKAGGKLFLTDRRLIFRTNWIDSWFFASVAIDLADIETVDSADRTYNVNDGGLARRVRVRLRDGAEHLFVLWPRDGGADAYANKLQELLNRDRADSSELHL